MTDRLPDVLSPRDESRLELAWRARALAERSADLVPVEIDPEPGTLIAQAMELRTLAEEVLNAAVVVERESGLATNAITEVTGRRYWDDVVLAWVQGGRRNRSGVLGPSLAKNLDEWAARQTPEQSSVVTNRLDGVRFPGSAQYEAHQRERVAGLHSALSAALKERSEAWDALNELTSDDESVDHPVIKRVVEACRTLASVYRDLSTAEPVFAHEYWEQVTQFVSTADRFAGQGPSA
ncbi:hypothetical protein [Streptomyces sp. NPDC056549]|uniref:hypothetical protein n=1 Tax=Streptomyces sp. NPDC056549 TaxID=3345864 RepID=UPI00368CF4D7